LNDASGAVCVHACGGAELDLKSSLPTVHFDELQFLLGQPVWAVSCSIRKHTDYCQVHHRALLILGETKCGTQYRISGVKTTAIGIVSKASKVMRDEWGGYHSSLCIITAGMQTAKSLLVGNDSKRLLDGAT
jgi:hypothetical protein